MPIVITTMDGVPVKPGDAVYFMDRAPYAQSYRSEFQVRKGILSAAGSKAVHEKRMAAGITPLYHGWHFVPFKKRGEDLSWSQSESVGCYDYKLHGTFSTEQAAKDHWNRLVDKEVSKLQQQISNLQGKKV